MTLKECARFEFHSACAEWQAALASGDGERIIKAALRLHIAKGSVPKRIWPMANQTPPVGAR